MTSTTTTSSTTSSSSSSVPGIRIVCISDTHGAHGGMSPLPSGDVLIHGGDFSRTGVLNGVQSFLSWLDSQPHAHKVFIAGNHDTSLHREYYKATGAQRFHRISDDKKADEVCDQCREMVDTAASTYLEDSGVTLTFSSSMGADGGPTHLSDPSHTINIYGSPWQPSFCNWAFNLERGDPLRAVWSAIPQDCDVLVTHSPPHGLGDRNSEGMNCGCEDLLYEVTSRESPPRLHIFGHIHDDYGWWSNGKTLFVNASTFDSSGDPSNAAVVVFLPFDKNLPASVVIFMQAFLERGNIPQYVL